MGFGPAQVDAMSLWQFACCVDGWADANNPEKEEELPALSYDDFQQFMRQ